MNFGTTSEIRGHLQRHLTSQMSPCYGTSCYGTDEDLDSHFGVGEKVGASTSCLMVTPVHPGCNYRIKEQITNMSAGRAALA